MSDNGKTVGAMVARRSGEQHVQDLLSRSYTLNFDDVGSEITVFFEQFTP